MNKAWHITTALHNSRYSQRMFDNCVKLDRPVRLSEKDEIVITEVIAKIVKEDKLKIYEYNICGDHMHILLACKEEKLTTIVGKLKAVSGRACNIERGVTFPASNADAASNKTRGHVPLTNTESKPKKKKKYNPFWTQKFGRREITDEYDLRNVIEYIKNNREKHKLPTNKRIRTLAEEMCRACDG